MGFGGALFAMSAATAVSQISQGYAQKSEAQYNASLLEGKAKLIDVQKEIDAGKYTRMKGQYLSKSTAAVAKQGIALEGSALASIINTQTQINIDQAISSFNFDQEKNYTKAQADAQRRAGAAAVREGYTNAFSTLLTGASNYASYKQKPKNTAPKPTSTTFDFNTKLPQIVGGTR